MNIEDSERFARQIPLFGREGQEKIRNIHTVHIGYGGLGTHIFQQTKYLGVRKSTVIEPQNYEKSNHGRYIGFSHDDIGKDKVAVAKRVASTIDPSAETEVIQAPLESEEAFNAVKKADLVFGSFDCDGPRAILNELCIAYGVAYIDVASEIHKDGTYGGRIAVIHGGKGCLYCIGDGLDQDEVRRYMSENEQLENESVIYGVDKKFLIDETSPSVVSINGVVASLAMVEFQALVTNIRAPIPYLNYRGHMQMITTVKRHDNVDCYCCSQHLKKGSANVERYLKLNKSK